MTTVLVTGGSGFVGRAVVRRLQARDTRVASLGRSETRHPALEHHSIAWPLTRAQASVVLTKIVPQIIIHLAAAPPAAPADIHAAITRDSALALIEAAGRICPQARLVTIGSAAEYGADVRCDRPLGEDDPCLPVTDHARAKHAVTQAVAMRWTEGGNVTTLRLFGAAGPGMPEHMLLGRVARALLRPSDGGEDAAIRVGSLECRRDYLDVEEAARLITELALGAQRPPPLVNIASGHAVTMRVIVEAMMRRAGGVRRLVEDPMAFSPGPASIAGRISLLEALGLKAAIPMPERLAARALAAETLS